MCTSNDAFAVKPEGFCGRYVCNVRAAQLHCWHPQLDVMELDPVEELICQVALVDRPADQRRRALGALQSGPTSQSAKLGKLGTSAQRL